MSRAQCLLALVFSALLIATVSGQQVPHTVHFERAGGVQTLNVTTVRLLAFPCSRVSFPCMLCSTCFAPLVPLRTPQSDTIHLSLSGTPSTGYSWYLLPNSTGAVLLEKQHETDVPPDNWTFDFTVIEKNSGVYQIIAGYAKPWYESRASLHKKFNFAPPRQ